LPLPGGGGAHTYLFNADPAALQAAVAAGGEVALAFDGTVYLTNTLVISNSVTLDATGYNVTLNGSNIVSVQTNSLNRVVNVYSPIVTVSSNGSLMMTNLVLANGLNQGWYSSVIGMYNTPQVISGSGGAISNGGAVIAINCVFSNNVAAGLDGYLIFADGEGYYAADGSEGFGGAIYNLGALTVINCLFTGNRAVGGNGHAGITTGNGALITGPGYEGAGGAIYNVGQLSAFNCFFTNDCAIGGAGGTWTNRNTDQFNYGYIGYPGSPGGTGDGGSIWSSGAAAVNGTSFVKNQAAGGEGSAGLPGDAEYDGPNGPLYGGNGGAGANGAGGALGAEAGTFVVVNSTFSSNSAVGSSGGAGGQGGMQEYADLGPGTGGNGGNGGNGMGGAIGISGGLGALTNVTLSDDISLAGAEGPGGAGGGSSIGGTNGTSGTNGLAGVSMGETIGVSGGTVVMLNSILSCGSGLTNGFGGIVDAGYNLNSDSVDYLTNGTSLNGVDIGLGLYGYYGGFTPTVPLLAGSPAIDAADPSFYPTNDQRGVIRPQESGPDIGAFEYTSVAVQPTVQTSTQGGGLTLGWNALPGLPYQIQSTTNLSQGVWSNVGGVVVATNLAMVVSEVVTNSAQGFYRVVLLP
jgi:hypothetical protein